MGDRPLSGYIDVAQRIAEFYERYPEGSLQPADPAHPWEQATVTGYNRDSTEPVTQTFIVYTAAAYRTPDDARPGIGIAWEVWPGRTNFTRGSEVMNAETSAWGRAIAALGIATKEGIATRQEVEARRHERDDGLPVNADGSLSRSRTTDAEKDAAGVMTAAQQAEHTALRPKAADDRGKVARGKAPGPDPWETAIPADGNDPGSIRLNQQRAIHAKCGDMPRDERIATISDIVGRPVASSSELSYTEAARVLEKLS